MKGRSVYFDSLLFGLYALVGVAGLLLLRCSLPRLSAEWGDVGLRSPALPYVVLGGLIYLLSFGIWLVILARTPLAVAYPIAVGLTLVLGALLAKYLLGEDLTRLHVAGMVSISLGIILLSQASG